MTIFQAIVLAIVEGLTEFLPISSTGHLIVTQYFLQIPPSDFVKTYIVSIQFGAILAVVFLYYKEFFKSWKFYLNLLVAFLPAAVLGLLFHHYIETFMESVIFVAFNLFFFGIILLFIDRWGNHHEEKKITVKNAFMIGLFQSIAMLPGVSRSAASIIGGLAQKLTRKQAAEFSFFLAVPTIAGATFLELYKHHDVLINPPNIKLIAMGNLVSFLVAMIVIKLFINFLVKHGFKAFGWYRIVFGLFMLILIALDVNLTSI